MKLTKQETYLVIWKVLLAKFLNNRIIQRLNTFAHNCFTKHKNLAMYRH